MYWFILMERNLISNIDIKSPTKNEELSKYDECDSVRMIVFGWNRKSQRREETVSVVNIFCSGRWSVKNLLLVFPILMKRISHQQIVFSQAWSTRPRYWMRNLNVNKKWIIFQSSLWREASVHMEASINHPMLSMR